MSEQHSKGVPWNAEKLEIIDPGRPYVLSNGKAVLKDPSRTVFHEHQFSFRSSNYAHGEKEAKEHAVLMARFHRLLAEKGYFHPSTMIPDRPSNFGRDEKGRVWATDLGLWIYESEVPSAEKLRKILKKTSTQAKKSKTSPPRT